MVRIGTEVDADLWEQFRQDVKERRGTVKGTLSEELENAIRQYLEKDEFSRLESRMASLEETIHEDVVGADHSQNEKKKRADSSPSDTVMSKLRRIEDRIFSEYDGVHFVTEREVEEIVEEVAGASAPTLRKYKQLLKDRNILFPSPVQDNRLLKFDSPADNGTDFVANMKKLKEQKDIRPERYQELVQEYGQEWWRERWADVADEWKRENGFLEDEQDQGRGFQ